MTRPQWLDSLVGTELRDALEVEVHFPNEPPLTTGDLVFETDRGWFQIIGAAPDRTLRTMRAPNEVKLIGDWSDRSGIVLNPTRAIDVPFKITRVDYVQRGDGTGGEDTLGAWLVGEASAVRIALLFVTDDAEIGPPTRLWSHLTESARNERKIVLFGQK